MKALILRDDAEDTAAAAKGLMDKGFQVVCVESRRLAHEMIRVETVDLMVADERIDGRLTHALLLSAERRNPYISTIMLTDRPGREADELYDLIPSLYAQLSTDVTPKLLCCLAMSSIENYDEIAARIARQELEDAGDAATAQIFWDNTADHPAPAIYGPVMPADSMPDDAPADDEAPLVAAIEPVVTPGADTGDGFLDDLVDTLIFRPAVARVASDIAAETPPVATFIGPSFPDDASGPAPRFVAPEMDDAYAAAVDALLGKIPAPAETTAIGPVPSHAATRMAGRKTAEPLRRSVP
ncbi:hypothetical protein [Yoonia sp. SS1-5]|uniref:Uncharacterized protein n=1 Tax=Yoonia rhodophyticola TaxID=3137370 RepID=A0AAN0MF56_9RHOB